jgi:hypothetical protein
MGRPVAPLDRQKPFADALRVALLSGAAVCGSSPTSWLRKQSKATCRPYSRSSDKLKGGGHPQVK